MSTKYTPSDIQPPERYSPYGDTLGTSEYEWIAAYLVLVSQQEGAWVAVKQFPKKHVDEKDLQDMMADKRLVKREDGYMLSDDTIDDLAKAYPASKTRYKWYDLMKVDDEDATTLKTNL